MQDIDGRLVFAASDLLNYLQCSHLTHLDRELALGNEELVPERSDASELVAAKGDEHERGYLAWLEQNGYEVVEIERGAKGGSEDLVRGAERTREAMRCGAEVIHGGVLFDGERWHGYTDFLERVDGSSAWGAWSYEVADTKLARRVKPYFLLQLCFYSDLLATCQQTVPSLIHVVLGSHARESFRLGDFAAYYRRVRSGFEALVASGAGGTYPEPVEHCGVCHWHKHCTDRWIADDHLSRVAGMRRVQRTRLSHAGIDTVARLAVASPESRPARLGEHAFNSLRQQARLQVSQRATGRCEYELLRPQAGQGLAQLPKPSDGDLFFDIEGDPYFEDGLEYLLGLVYLERREPTFLSFWAMDREDEKRAFEEFIDFTTDRLRRYPDLHVYHYSQYEPTALKRLMGLHSTREEELDQLLRSEVFCDLYTVVRQALRISQPSYSIKHLEPFYMQDRDTEVAEGGDSIVWFERYLETGDRSQLEAIERYNAADCRSTYLLRDWLLERKLEAQRQFETDIAFKPCPEATSPDPGAQAELDGRRSELARSIAPDRGDRDAEQEARWLLAQLLDYHRREAKPQWWAYFERRAADESYLTETDTEALGGLRDSGIAATRLAQPAKSVVCTLQFPPQEHKITPGTFVDPATGAGVTVESIDDANGLIKIRRGLGVANRPLPRALIPGGPYDTRYQRDALGRLADDVIANGLGARTRYAALRDILCRRAPALGRTLNGDKLQSDGFDLEQAKLAAEKLTSSYLFIQGPPGSGKTHTASRMICDLLARGARVGVCANSHAAIHNVLHRVEAFAGESPVWRGLKKHSGPGTRFDSRREPTLISNSDRIAEFADTQFELVAGTAWLFAREEMDGALDYLFVDEAGQLSLADALAIGTAARNIVLLGDPLQLAQVSQATHPPGTAASVLEHLLGEHGTVPQERGFFIDKTRRMHPDVCRFVSETIYEGRLESAAECAHQYVDSASDLSGTGIRFIASSHEGNTRSSPEEALEIARQVDALVGATYVTAQQGSVALRPQDIMVVSPYNAQVRCLREHLPGQVRVGTVDKFQGQEAAVVFFSMATSSGAEIPRNLEFVFSRNRLNVAISRARCLAVLVCNPQLLNVACKNADQMRLVNALCRLVEVADEKTGCDA